MLVLVQMQVKRCWCKSRCRWRVARVGEEVLALTSSSARLSLESLWVGRQTGLGEGLLSEANFSPHLILFVNSTGSPM